MRAVAELFTICAGTLAIASYAINYLANKRGRRRETNLEHTRRLEEENKEMDEMLNHITREREGRKWLG